MATEIAASTPKRATRPRRARNIWPFDGVVLRAVAPPEAAPAAQPAAPAAPKRDPDEEAPCLESPATLADDPGSRWMMPLMYDPAAPVPLKLVDTLGPAKPEKPAVRQMQFDEDLFGKEEDAEETLSGEPVNWPEDVVVRIHWRLLEDVKDLLDPEISIAHKLDVLGWVFADPRHDDTPFSFTSCVRVVTDANVAKFCGLSHQGKCDVIELRDLMRNRIRHSLDKSLEAYPAELRQFLADNPKLVHEKLSKDPQWFDKQVKKKADPIQGGLFG